MKWRLRSCPRCGGDTFIEKDLYGWYETCLQCGYWCELRDLDGFGQSPELKDKRPLGATGHEPMGK
jgi:hypothetical protein